MPLIAQIGFEANNINLALDQLKSARGRGKRNALVEQGLRAAERALVALQEEPLVTRTRAYVAEALERYDGNPLAVAEELRIDQGTIRWFVKAECALLRAAGFADGLVETIEADMLTVLAKPFTEPPDSLVQDFRLLAQRVNRDLADVRQRGERSEMYRTLAAVLGILGGCGVAVADTAAAAGTAGLAAGMLGLSVAVGVEIVDTVRSELLEE